MKKINISDGIKISLANLINKTQDIFTGNYNELIGRIFSPGFFVDKNSVNTLLPDFAPSVITSGTDDIIQVNIDGKRPAYCFTNSNKIIALNDRIQIDPRDINGYSYYNSTINTVNTVYELWVVPVEVDKEQTDYLPNYKIDGETKPLVKEYVVGLLLVKKGELPPRINDPNVISDTPGGVVVTPAPVRGVSLVEGLKLAEFTYNEYTTTISSLTDLRLNSRAYLKSELYDFFNENYLKHDYLLTHAEDSAGDNVLSFAKNGTGSPKLTGVFTLIGAKERIVSGSTTYPSKIKVTATNKLVPVNSVLAITVSSNDYNSASDLTKTLEVIPIDSFTPQVDKIVLGYHLRTYLDGGVTQEEEDSPGAALIPNLGGDEADTPTVNTEPSCIYFVNGLPPLPPGQNISRNGIGSYVLTKDEAEVAYFNKTKSDLRYIESGNDSANVKQETFTNDLMHVVNGALRSDDIFTGTKFIDDTIPTNIRAGYAWLNSANAPIAYIIRQAISDTAGLLEIGLLNNDGTTLQGVKLEDGFVKVIGPNGYAGNGTNAEDLNKLLTVANGLTKKGDSAQGNYDFKVGKLRFYQPNDTFSEDQINAPIPLNYIKLVAEFSYDSITDVVLNCFDHIITGLKDPRTGDEGKRDAVPREWVDTKISTLTSNIVKDNSLYDCAVTLTPQVEGYEFATVREAIESGKKRIQILPGNYNLATLDRFWPTSETVIPHYGIVIDGLRLANIIGNTEFLSTENIHNIKFDGLNFQSAGITDSAVENLVKIGNSSIAASDIGFSNCLFTGYKYIGAPSYGTIGLNISPIRSHDLGSLTIKNCSFTDNMIGIGSMTNDTYISDFLSYSPIKILDSVFSENLMGIAPNPYKTFVIDRNLFKASTNAQSFIGFSGGAYLISGGNYVPGGCYKYTSDIQDLNKVVITNNTFQPKGGGLQGAIYLLLGNFGGTITAKKIRLIVNTNHFKYSPYISGMPSIRIERNDSSLISGDHSKITLFNNYFSSFNSYSPFAEGTNTAGIYFVNGTAGQFDNYSRFVCGVLNGSNYYATLTDSQIKISNFID